MSFRTVTRSLTKNQKERGVVYSSMLVVTNKPGFDRELKEVFVTDIDKDRKIKLLKDVKWFKDFAREFDLDVVNYVRY